MFGDLRILAGGGDGIRACSYSKRCRWDLTLGLIACFRMWALFFVCTSSRSSCLIFLTWRIKLRDHSGASRFLCDLEPFCTSLFLLTFPMTN